MDRVAWEEKQEHGKTGECGQIEMRGRHWVVFVFPVKTDTAVSAEAVGRVLGMKTIQCRPWLTLLWRTMVLSLTLHLKNHQIKDSRGKNRITSLGPVTINITY